MGLRQGEVFGLAVEDVDFLRGTVRVQRQVAIVGNKLVFALPKNRKVREVPLPSSVRNVLSADLAAHPARTVTMPWETPSGQPVTARLFLASRESAALNRNHVDRSVWKPALRAAGTRIRTLVEYLGHNDPGLTLRTYTGSPRSSLGPALAPGAGDGQSEQFPDIGEGDRQQVSAQKRLPR